MTWLIELVSSAAGSNFWGSSPELIPKAHSHCDLCDLCPQLTFDYLLPTVTQYHKTTHTASPIELDQISLPQVSMAPSTTFHDPHCHSQI